MEGKSYDHRCMGKIREVEPEYSNGGRDGKEREREGKRVVKGGSCVKGLCMVDEQQTS